MKGGGLGQNYMLHAVDSSTYEIGIRELGLDGGFSGPQGIRTSNVHLLIKNKNVSGKRI